MALNATVKVEGAGGTREIAAADFFTGFFSTALEEGEIVTEIHIPEPVAGSNSSYQKFVQPASRFAIVGCAAAVVINNGLISEARVAFNGVSGEGAFLDEAVSAALVGKAATLETIEAAVAGAAEGIDINEDHYASKTYRRHLAKVYAKRALIAACKL